MTLRTTADKLLIQLEKEGDKTEGGLIRPDSAKKMLGVGRVVAIGEGIDPDKIKLGAKIVWPDFATHMFEFEGVMFGAVCWQDVQAIID
jgi:chaperonin GroES